MSSADTRPREFWPRAVVRVSVLWRDTQKAPTVLEAIPKSLEVESNDFKTTDTFKCTFVHRDFPWNPQAIKAVFFEAWMAAGVVPDMPQPGVNPALYSKLLYGDPLITGYVDEPKVTLKEDGYQIELEGRDQTALLIDTDIPPGQKIPIGRPLDEVIRFIADLSEATKTLKVVNNTGGPMPIVSSWKEDTSATDQEIESQPDEAASGGGNEGG